MNSVPQREWMMSASTFVSTNCGMHKAGNQFSSEIKYAILIPLVG